MCYFLDFLTMPSGLSVFQESCGLCGLKKPDPTAEPKSPHWAYGVKADGQPKIAEGSCVHCRYVVYKGMKTTFAQLRKPDRADELRKAIRMSKTRRFAVSTVSKASTRLKNGDFQDKKSSSVNKLTKSAAV